MSRRTERVDEIVVFWTRNDSRCDGCGEELWRGSLLRVEEGKAFCLTCSDLDHLVFLPRGDPALTRRASRHSGLRAVVVRWSPTRKRYERQGVLVEEEALRRAEEECLSDAEAREARRRRGAERREALDRAYVERFARAVRERYPNCPRGTEVEVAEHACLKYSGRVGRSAAAKRLDPEAIDLAVQAHVRHRRTAYDRYLMSGWDRAEARAAVVGEVEALLAAWRG